MATVVVREVRFLTFGASIQVQQGCTTAKVLRVLDTNQRGVSAAAVDLIANCRRCIYWNQWRGDGEIQAVSVRQERNRFKDVESSCIIHVAVEAGKTRSSGAVERRQASKHWQGVDQYTSVCNENVVIAVCHVRALNRVCGQLADERSEREK